MSSELFSGMPSISIPRSRWKNAYNITGSYKHGYLIPVDALPILPGDGLNFKLRDFTRMQTPIAPIFGNIKKYYAAFFVPLRLVWEHTEEHFGANKTSAGPQNVVYNLPQARFTHVDVGSLSHYLGKPLKGSAETDVDGNSSYAANILKERAYFLIWNEYFRAQQITNPVLLNVSDSSGSYDVAHNKIGTFGGNQIDPGSTGSLKRVAKEFDYFTASTISPQYGAAVTIPLGTSAPIVLASTGNVGYANSSISNGNPTTSTVRLVTAGSGDVGINNTSVSSGENLEAWVNSASFSADLQNATAANVNTLRFSFAIQKYLERANFAGNYFFGILQVHYGVTSPDSRLQRPEFLGEFSEDILVHQVVSTADTTNTVSGASVRTSVGNTGAMSATVSGDVYLFDKAFVEPGFVVVLQWCRHRQVYSQGIMREDFKKDRFETYTPELCNLGDQATLTRELYWKAGETEVFGFNEHWAEYRYRFDRVNGMLDPNGANSLDFWTLANKFTTKPQLNDDFIMERRDELDRALVTGSSYDEYVHDTWIECTWTREMPVRTIPGLIDHFGAM